MSYPTNARDAHVAGAEVAGSSVDSRLAKACNDGVIGVSTVQLTRLTCKQSIIIHNIYVRGFELNSRVTKIVA